MGMLIRRKRNKANVTMAADNKSVAVDNKKPEIKKPEIKKAGKKKEV